MLTATMASPASASASMASPDSFRQVQGALQIGLGQDRGELLAAIASDDVSRAVDASRGEPSDDPQHLVALGMAIMVVERLDLVRVDHDQVPFRRGRLPSRAWHSSRGRSDPLHPSRGKSCRLRGPLGGGDARGEANDQSEELGLSLGAELGEDGAQTGAGGK